jgi:hypothetical protein
MAPSIAFYFQQGRQKERRKHNKDSALDSLCTRERHQEGEKKRVEIKEIKISASRLDRGMFAQIEIASLRVVYVNSQQCIKSEHQFKQQ